MTNHLSLGMAGKNTDIYRNYVSKFNSCPTENTARAHYKNRSFNARILKDIVGIYCENHVKHTSMSERSRVS